MHPLPLRCFAALTVAVALGGCSQSEDAGASAAAGASRAGAADCGRVTVARMSWDSAEVLAHVDRLILTRGYGCEVELVPGDTVPTLTTMMEKGQPDVAPETWVGALGPALDEAVRQGRIRLAARALTDGGVEGWWMPRFVAQAHPEIRTIDDALRHPALFPSGDGVHGAVHNCPAGWMCQHSTANAFRAWEAEKRGFVLVDPGSAEGLDASIAQAHERRVGWLGYYWSPTAVLGRYDMVRLEAGVPHDAQRFLACNARADCERPAKTDWARAEVYTVVSGRLAGAGGPVMDYLGRRGWSNETVNALLAWMSEQQAPGDDAALHFLRTQPQLWRTWVTPPVADRIAATL